MAGFGEMDLTSLGLDAAVVGAVNEMTNWVKERLKEWTWDDKFHRLYPLIPFLCAFVLCVLMKPSIQAAFTDSIRYGLWASFAWRTYKVSVKGE